MHEGQPDELGEAAGLVLKVTTTKQVADPVLGTFDRPVHDGHVGSDADGMGDAVSLQPLIGGDLVGT